MSETGETRPSGRVQPVAWKPIAIVAGVVALVLFAFSGRYGYHRDELYFLACGRHLAWGYPDQPPLTPLLARIMSSIDGQSLVVLRLPSDLASFVTVFITGLIAREFGAGRWGQIVAAVAMAMSNLLLGSGHLLSTETFNLTGWAALTLVIVHALRTGDERWWPVAGVVAGLSLFDSDLVFFLAIAVGIGVALVGPRQLFASRWLWLGVLIAGLMWTPYLIWQAQHGWPELTVAKSIANGGSGTSAPRWQIPIQQLYLASPALVPMWIAGLVRLCRAEELRWCRAFGVAYFALLVMFVITGGKPYYLSGMFPLLLAVGAQPSVDWARRHVRWRVAWVAFAGVATVIGLLITLPIVPESHLHKTNIVAVNYDAGETVGWPAYVEEISRAYGLLTKPAARHTIVLTGNYGEAGAVERYGPHFHLPPVYSGDLSFWLWGPPPGRYTNAVAVGLSRATLERNFDTVRMVGRLNNHLDVDDDEQDTPIYLCTGLRGHWHKIWPRLKDYH